MKSVLTLSPLPSLFLPILFDRKYNGYIFLISIAEGFSFQLVSAKGGWDG